MGNISAGTTWPTTYTQRQTEWKRRIASALVSRYDDNTIKAMGLFRATDPSGITNHETQRVVRDPSFVTSVDAGMLVSGLTLSLPDDAVPPDYVARSVGDGAALDASKMSFQEEGDQVWMRSRLLDQARRWAWMVCAAGDFGLEVVEKDGVPGDTMIIGHRPDHFEVFYDSTGLTIDRVDIEYDYSSEPDAEGNVTEHTYERQITPEEIKTRIDGGGWQVVPNPTGVVTFVHLQFEPSPDPEIGLHAAHGIESGAAVVDSVVTMMSTIGSQNAAPILKMMNAMLDTPSGDEGSAIGKVFNLGSDQDAQWLELSMTGLGSLWQFAAELRETYRQTLPEFMFTDAGASASGTALSYRAGHLRMKMAPVAAAFRRGIARATNIAICLRRNIAYSDDRSSWFEVDGAPVLPQDKAAIAALTTSLVEDGFLKRTDATRLLQGLDVGIPQAEDAAMYVDEALMEHDLRQQEAVQMLGTLTSIKGKQGAEPTAAVEQVQAEEVDAATGGQLNGAQIASALDIINQVAVGDLPRESGINALQEFFAMSPATANKLMGAVGRGFVAASAKPTPPQ